MTTEVANVMPPAGSASAGALLKKAREAKGIHISVMATTLRVPLDRIRALEDDRWNDLPDLVFARALAMSVCRQLKIDASPVLAGIPDPDPMRSVRVTAAISEPLGGVVNRSQTASKIWLALGLLAVFLMLWVALGMQASVESRLSTSVEAPGLPPNPAPEVAPPAASEAPADANAQANPGASGAAVSAPMAAPVASPTPANAVGTPAPAAQKP
ncbi:MAG: hypothetical protein RL657_1147 [Pseudomonadota bacterium]|jgi:cytoskeleton protein RodZ